MMKEAIESKKTTGCCHLRLQKSQIFQNPKINYYSFFIRILFYKTCLLHFDYGVLIKLL